MRSGCADSAHTMTRKNLVVAVDFGAASNIVIEKAGELAQQISARIVLVYVIEPAAALVPLGNKKRSVGAAWPLRTSKRVAEARARLNALAQPLKAAGIGMKSEVAIGLLGDELLRISVKYRADYVVLGTSEPPAKHLTTRGAFGGLLNRIACPVIIVPARASF
jgi:nucleotide-binding universal stress UspA family protein